MFKTQEVFPQGPMAPRARRTHLAEDVERGLERGLHPSVSVGRDPADRPARAVSPHRDEDGNDGKHGSKTAQGSRSLANARTLIRLMFTSSEYAYLVLAACAVLVGGFAAFTLQGTSISLSPAASEGYAVAHSHTCGTEEERIGKVFAWVRARGAHIHRNVSLGTFPIPGTGTPPKMVRGLMASGTIKHEEVLFAVPPQLLLNIGKLEKHPRLGEAWRAVPELHKGMSGLAVLLLHEAMNASSYWRPYLCTLPRHVPLPIFYSPKKLVRERERWVPQDQEERFDDMIEKARDVLEVHYVEVMPKLFTRFPHLFSPADYTYARWAWACSIIMSRTWGRKFTDDVMKNVTGENSTTVHTLVPAADMPNHATGSFEARSAPDGTLVLKAHGNLSRGDHITISYGKKCDAEFLANYGFVPFNNSNHKCHLMFGNSSKAAGKMIRLNQTAWRDRWRSHFALFYTNLVKAQALAEKDREGFANTVINTSSDKARAALFFTPLTLSPSAMAASTSLEG